MESSFQARQLSGLSRWEAVYELVKFLAVLLLFAQVSFADSGTYLNIIKGHSPTLLLVATEGVSKDTNGKVSSWKDLASGIEFVQATAANKPFLSKLDEYRENLCLQSEDFATTWNVAGEPVSVSANSTASPVDGLQTADTITATIGSNKHTTYQVIAGMVAGESYRASVYVKAGTYQYLHFSDGGDAAWHSVAVDLSDGSSGSTGIVSKEVTSVGSGWYKVSLVFTRTNAGNAAIRVGFETDTTTTGAPPTWEAAGTETIIAWGVQLERFTANGDYVKTTTAPRHEGVSGLPVLDFDGVGDVLSSSITLGSLIANNASTIFIVAQTDTITSNDVLFSDASAYMWAGQRATGNTFEFWNYDGNNDVTAITNVANELAIFQMQHGGDKIYLSRNGVAATQASSGNTSNVTAAMNIGKATADGWDGKVFAIITFNTVLDEADRTEVYNALRGLVNNPPKGEWDSNEGGRPWFR